MKKSILITALLFFVAFAVIILALVETSFAQNPIDLGSNIRTADPSAHVWNDGRIYVYTSHDEECQEDFWIKDWYVFSSDDLVNWSNHAWPDIIG